jgi:hypothetical protein
MGHQFSCGWLRLEPGEILVARFRPDEVPYWSLGVANYWYETLGFGEPGSEINNQRVEYEEEGLTEMEKSDQGAIDALLDLKFEDLVAAPNRELERLAGFLEIGRDDE